MEQVITQDMALFFDQCHPNSLYGVTSEDEQKKYEIAVRKTEGNVLTFCLADRTTNHIVPLTMERVFSASEAETEEPLTEFFQEYLEILIHRKFQVYRFPNRQELSGFFEDSMDRETAELAGETEIQSHSNGNGHAEMTPHDTGTNGNGIEARIR